MTHTYDIHCPKCKKSSSVPSNDPRLSIGPMKCDHCDEEIPPAWKGSGLVPEADAPPKTVRVRIAITVNSAGGWDTFGNSEDRTTDADALQFSKEHMEIPEGAIEATYWIEADVPLPVVPVFKGEVSEPE